MIAVTPPIISSKEVAQKQATPFPRQDLLTARNRFTPNFQGWRLDENLKPTSPPYRGGPDRGSPARQNEVSLAARAAMLRARSGASILHCDHGACGHIYDCAIKAYK